MTDMRSKLIAIVEVANEECGVFREADHGVAEAVNSQVCEDSGRGMRGRCPGRWRRWTPVARSPRILGILSIVFCSRVFCHDKLSPEWLRPRIPGRC